eukprot:1149107-Pelagomonas_calceolata.AAC.5
MSCPSVGGYLEVTPCLFPLLFDLCTDTKPGDELTMTGPSGAVLLLPEQHFEVRQSAYMTCVNG